MRSSNFTLEKKKQILNEKILEGISVQEVCKRYRITAPTYYSWRRKIMISEINTIPVNENQKNTSPENENQILRKLYINLSAHNYELAKFLDK